MTATEALAKALETNWWGLNGHIGQEAADKLRTALHSEGYTIVPSEEIERLRAVEKAARDLAGHPNLGLRDDFRSGEDIVLRWPGNREEWLALRSALEGTPDDRR